MRCKRRSLVSSRVRDECKSSFLRDDIIVVEYSDMRDRSPRSSVSKTSSTTRGRDFSRTVYHQPRKPISLPRNPPFCHEDPSTTIVFSSGFSGTSLVPPRLHSPPSVGFSFFYRSCWSSGSFEVLRSFIYPALRAEPQNDVFGHQEAVCAVSARLQYHSPPPCENGRTKGQAAEALLFQERHV